MGKKGSYIATWQQLPASGKMTFLKASVVLVLIKAGLSLLPFSVFKKLFHFFTKSSRKREIAQAEIDRVVWAVDTAANILPMTLLCLPRALAAKYLLRELPAVTLEIGVEINPAKKFEAHAWVEKNGNIIIGDWPQTVTYQRLWVWN